MPLTGNAESTLPRRPETVADVLRAAIKREHGTQVEFARALGVTPAQVSGYLKHHESLLPSTLDKILTVIESVTLQARLQRAYARRFEPVVELPADASPELIVSSMDELMGVGMVTEAIDLAERELARASAYGKWMPIAERLQPLYLEVDRISQGLELREEIERRAWEAGDMRGVAAASAMTDTALASIHGVTPSMVRRSMERTLAVVERWVARSEEAKHHRFVRELNMARNHAINLLRFTTERRLGSDVLEEAGRLVESSMSSDAPEYVVACGIEARARVLAERGLVVAAEDSLEELEAFGMEKAWGMWEKSRITMARIAEQRGELDRAMQLLKEVRDRCETMGNTSHAKKADQLLARLQVVMAT